MAYLIFSTGNEELLRRELKDALVLGRAPDCDVSIHDILLSRRHCRFEPNGDGWTLVDLSSKNGTQVGTEKVDRWILKPGDIIQAGKTFIHFHSGTLIPAPRSFVRPKEPQPIDPGDAMAGTVSGFEYVEPPPPTTAGHSLPTPRPRPRDPQSFSRDSIYSMLEEIASSSWDSIYEVNAQPLRRERAMPRPIIRGPHTTINLSRSRPRRPELSLLLQATAPIAQMDCEPQTSHAPAHRVATVFRFTRRARVRLARLSRWVTRVSYMRLF